MPSAGEIQLPYGLRGEALLHISQVPSGLSCLCCCPGCGRPLVARKGSVRRHYFAHHRYSGTIGCLETMLHRLAKEVLAEEQHLMLPGLEVWEYLPPAEEDGLYLRALTGIDELPARQVDILEVRLEVRTGDIRPDVIVITQAGEAIAVEVAVTHKADDLKRRRLQDLGLAAVEFDLSRLPRNLTREAIRQALLNPTTPVLWLHHTQEADLRQSVQQQLQEQRQRSREVQLRERRQRQQLQALARAQGQTGLTIRRPPSALNELRKAGWWAHNLAAEDFFAAFGRWPDKQESHDLYKKVDQGNWQPVSQKYRWAGQHLFPRASSRSAAVTSTGNAYRLKKYGEL